MFAISQKSCFVLFCTMAVVWVGINVYASESYRCDDRECDINGACSFFDRTFPLENVCVVIIGTTDRDCFETSPGWTCSTATFDPPVKCATTYWNYIGWFGGAEDCKGANCLPGEVQGTLGHLLQSCSDEFEGAGT